MGIGIFIVVNSKVYKGVLYQLSKATRKRVSLVASVDICRVSVAGCKGFQQLYATTSMTSTCWVAAQKLGYKSATVRRQCP